ncbi:MAG TPA: hypothetical protein VIJ95_02480 [Hanamia sp.]
MRKILLIVLLFPVFCKCQSFTLTPYGLRDSADTSKGYIIIDLPNKSAKQIYDATINYINETYENPGFVIKGKIDSEYVRFDGYKDDISSAILRAPLGKAKLNIESDYSIEIRMKENKIKYQVISNHMKMESANVWTNGVNTSYGDLHIVQQGSNWRGWDKIFIYDKKLKLKDEDLKSDIEKYFNDQVTALVKYISNNDKW